MDRQQKPEKCWEVQLFGNVGNKSVLAFLDKFKRKLRVVNAAYQTFQNISFLSSMKNRSLIYKEVRIILPAVFWRCETWSVALREEHILMFKEAPGRIFGHVEEKMMNSGELHNEERVLFIKLRSTKWTGLVQLERSILDNIKVDVEEWGCKCVNWL